MPGPRRDSRRPADAWIRTGPLILIGHSGGLHKRLSRLVTRARHYAAEYGFAAAAIDAPGRGDLPRSAVDGQFRADLRRAVAAGEPFDEIVDAFGAREKTLHANLGGHTGTRSSRWTPRPGTSPSAPGGG